MLQNTNIEMLWKCRDREMNKEKQSYDTNNINNKSRQRCGCIYSRCNLDIYGGSEIPFYKIDNSMCRENHKRPDTKSDTCGCFLKFDDNRLKIVYIQCKNSQCRVKGVLAREFPKIWKVYNSMIDKECVLEEINKKLYDIVNS